MPSERRKVANRTLTYFQRLLWVYVLAGALVSTWGAIVVALAFELWWSDEPATAASLVVPAWGQRGNNLILFVHLVTAIPPLLIGPFLFLRGLLRSKRFRFLHRWLGTIYVFAIFASTITGGILATLNRFGPVAQWGFGMLAVAWFVTTYYAYRTAREKNFVRHREWMIRSFAVTLAVVAFRLLPNPEAYTMDQWYPVKTWLCWVPNLILAECYIRITTFRGQLRRFKWLG